MDPKYDELHALYQYLSFDKQAFMTPLELRADSLGVLREKAMRETNPGVRKLLFRKFESEVDDEVLGLLGDDLTGIVAFRERVAKRIRNDAVHGRLALNRCPSCSKITRTPNARQCLWCGHDWHATA